MTNQELFDRVAKHLLTQMARSVPTVEMVFSRCWIPNLKCAYRGRNGMQCAIGCCISDENYRPELEGKGVTDPDVTAAAGLTQENLPLAGSLQTMHDNDHPMFWKANLRRWAAHYGVSAEVVA